MKQDLRAIAEQFLYCSFCGGFLEYTENNLMQCQSCLKHLYINPRPVNGVVLENEKDEILLVKRRSDPGIGKWDLPGGFVDLNENMETSTKRELKEELGIEIHDLSYFDSFVDVYEYQGIIYPTLGLIFTAKIHSEKEIKVTSDITEAEFFSQDHIPFEELAFESIGRALKKLLNN